MGDLADIISVEQKAIAILEAIEDNLSHVIFLAIINANIPP
ncbi:MAG: hypothetical protein RMY29_027975 [Nostoc sp. CreGUA01]|nr:hypothetical protein [Nostoc sp. CreGUA01]